ncbi:LysM peptidoglycan-binding domain-containing protein [Nocardioides zeicaulis]|uniref:LysM peptidoglycan-binding domain-containing protein n=1 Tax=Nocardioides zeicaulis TaxID=1776857 RepID=A0ABV6E5Q8_9ACTN
MSRGIIRPLRTAVVWLLASAAALGAARLAAGSCTASTAPGGPTGAAPLLVAVCAVALAVALAWLWVVTTWTVVEVATGRVRAGGGATRRLVLLACGAAVVAGVASPAAAAGGGGRADVLAGLALPERAVAPSASPAPVVDRPGTGDYVVRAGDSLWSIARDHPAAATSTDERWREIWRANRAVVGTDPDLIHPGQALRLPVHNDGHQDGDR